jgi:septal ring factor EnvC (AmiA/AmiB activator)
LRGSKVGFAKIVKLIDDLVATLKKEQLDDDDKKEYCGKQLDAADDKKKALSQSIDDTETVIEETKEGLATTAEEIKALKAGIVALDKMVAEATEQRRKESAEHKELMAGNGAAKELILFAKNRLNKFYNPKMYKAPPKRELSEGDRIYENQGGEIPTEAPGGIANTGISFIQIAHRSAPPPPPATAAAYTKKATESNGVLAMMDLLVADLDKEMTISSTEEKNAQAEYVSTMSDAANKRRQDAKTLTDKTAAMAEMESGLERSKENLKATQRELMGALKYISSLHAECDWLLQYFDVRKTARADEIDSLTKAKAVLNGADYSFVQQKFLRSPAL